MKWKMKPCRFWAPHCMHNLLSLLGEAVMTCNMNTNMSSLSPRGLSVRVGIIEVPRTWAMTSDSSIRTTLCMVGRSSGPGDTHWMATESSASRLSDWTPSRCGSTISHCLFFCNQKIWLQGKTKEMDQPNWVEKNIWY